MLSLVQTRSLFYWCKPNRVPCAADTTPHDGLRLNPILFPGTPVSASVTDGNQGQVPADKSPQGESR